MHCDRSSHPAGSSKNCDVGEFAVLMTARNRRHSMARAVNHAFPLVHGERLHRRQRVQPWRAIAQRCLRPSAVSQRQVHLRRRGDAHGPSRGSRTASATRHGKIRRFDRYPVRLIMARATALLRETALAVGDVDAFIESTAEVAPCLRIQTIPPAIARRPRHQVEFRFVRGCTTIYQANRRRRYARDYSCQERNPLAPCQNNSGPSPTAPTWPTSPTSYWGFNLKTETLAQLTTESDFEC